MNLWIPRGFFGGIFGTIHKQNINEVPVEFSGEFFGIVLESILR